MYTQDVKDYFEKNGKIYGVSSKYQFGEWDNKGYIFYDLDKAWEWFETEEYDFRERELLTQEEAYELFDIDVDDDDPDGIFEWESEIKGWI